MQPYAINNIFSSTAINAVVMDTIGVLFPKLVISRSAPATTESIFLEVVENVPFYAGATLLGRFAFGPLYKFLLKLNKNETLAHIGTPLKALGEGASKQLIAAKIGTVFGIVALAGGFEFLVSHVNNYLTHSVFKLNNFTAVAGLEKARTQIKQGEEDPVAKAKNRFIKVPLISLALATVGGIFAAAVLHSPSALNAAKRILQHFDFGVNAEKSAFDLSKPLLSLMIASGVTSYLDAARGDFERVEVGFRLSVVVPYLLAGKNLIGNALARLHENAAITLPNGQKGQIKDLVPFTDKSLLFRDSFLDFNQVKGSVFKEVQALKVEDALKETILNRFNRIGHQINYFAFAGMGITLGLLSYALTRYRFNQKNKAAAQQATLDQTQLNTPSPAVITGLKPVEPSANPLQPVQPIWVPSPSVAAYSSSYSPYNARPNFSPVYYGYRY
jgi:hypothetical protein